MTQVKTILRLLGYYHHFIKHYTHQKLLHKVGKKRCRMKVEYVSEQQKNYCWLLCWSLQISLSGPAKHHASTQDPGGITYTSQNLHATKRNPSNYSSFKL